jgi:hypothetical protein
VHYGFCEMHLQGLAALFAVALAREGRSLNHAQPDSAAQGPLDSAPVPSMLYNVPDVKGYIWSNYGQTWNVVDDRDCDAYFPAGYYSPAFQGMLCSKNPSADGFIATLDDDTSPALCAKGSAIADLCWSLDDCYGYVTQKDFNSTGQYDSDRGYLLKYDCGAPSMYKFEKYTTLYEKMEPTGYPGSCSLGEVMTVYGGKYKEVAGAYKKTTEFGGGTTDAYKKVGGLAKVTWHVSGCGWVVSRKIVPMGSRVRRLDECQDFPSELATLLGSDASENLCETLVDGWGMAAYCSDPVVAKLCANTCDRCDTHESEPDVCTHAACGSPVYKVLCPETCASDKATMDTAVADARVAKLRLSVKGVLPSWKASNQRAEFELEAELEAKRRLGTEKAELEAEKAIARRLGKENYGGTAFNPATDYTNSYEEVYRTFPTPGGNIPKCQTGSVAPTKSGSTYTGSAALPQLALYDVVAYQTPVAVGLSHYCPNTENAYVTSNFTHCPRTNIIVQHHALASVSQHSCWTKCSDPSTPKTTDTIGADGTPDWCSGFSTTFTKETTALCLPRETCEELCTALGPECHSIDMHRSRPLCYLNAADAGTGNSCSDPNYLVYEYKTSEFDLLTKTTTPLAPEKDTERITWKTYTGKKLTLPRDPFPTVQNFTSYILEDSLTQSTTDRVRCEMGCLLDPDCYGFYIDMGFSPTYCAIVQYQCKNEDGSGRPCTDEPVFEDGYFPPAQAMIGPDPVGTEASPSIIGHAAFVLKVVPDPCFVGVDTVGGKVILDKKLGFSSAGDQYVSSDNLTRLAFVTGEQGCDGWKYETHTDPLGKTMTLHNCTDFPAGANVFLKAYLGKSPGMKGAGDPGSTKYGVGTAGGDFEFPCQYAYDEGLCTDIVIQGLCAHTCTPLKVIALQGNVTKYQDTNLVIDYTAAGLTEPNYLPTIVTNTTECTGDNDVAAYAFITKHVGYPWDHFDHLGPKGQDRGPIYNFCDDLVRWKGLYNTTTSACVLRPWSPIVLGLCKIACVGYMNPVDPAPTPPPIDETSPTGALFTVNRRLLKLDEARIAEEREKLVDLGELSEDYEVLGDDKWDEEHRRLRRLFFTAGEGTTSNMGAGPGFYETFIESSITVSYTDGAAPASMWDSVYQTWANGTDNVHSIYATGFSLPADYPTTAATLGTVCASSTVTGTADMYALMAPTAGVLEMYPSKPPLEDDVSLDFSCRTYKPCPRYFTCITDQPLVDLQKTAFDSASGATDFDPDTGVKPQVVVGSEMSFGYLLVGGSKWSLTDKIYRSALGSTEMKFKTIGTPAPFSYAVTQISTAAGGYYFTQYEGSSAVLATGTYTYISDFFEIKALDNTGSPIAGSIGVEITKLGAYPTTLLKLLSVAANGAVTPVAFSYTYDGQDKITATLPAGRYVVGTLPDKCFANPCDENADCDPGASGSNPCTCKAAYEGSGLNGECALKRASYTTDNFKYYVKIVNTDALQFGWHVNDIEVTLLDAAGTTLTGDLDTYTQSFPASTSVTGTVITTASKFYTGPIGKSHYPYATDKFTFDGTTGSFSVGPKYGNKNLGDSDTSTVWWSEPLNVYPESQSIEFILEGNKELVGLAVTQEVNHASSYRIEIGPTTDPNDPDCSMAEGAARCTPFHISDVYLCSMSSDCPKSLPYCVGSTSAPSTGQCSDKDETGSIQVTNGAGVVQNYMKIDTPISCGKASTQIFGEVMLFATSASDPTPVWSGVYYNDYTVMSACHCHRLCISHLEEGCKSWKFYEETGGAKIKHCYLQSSIFGPGEGYYGKSEASWTGWTSGTPQYRYYKDGFSTPKLPGFDRPFLLSVSPSTTTGEAFTLTVKGTGLPYSPNKALDESPLQRVKIVPAGASCAVRVPATVSGISCVKSTRKSKLLVENPQTVYTLCGPRPSATTATTLELSGVSIMPTTTAADYEVCYCEFDCFDPVRWQKVPGKISTPASTYTWVSTPDVVTRHATDMLGPSVKITVTRPAFGHHTLNQYWAVKLVRDYFSCDLNMDSDLFYLSSKSCDGPDVCTFDFNLYVSSADVGRYYVCFDEGLGSSAIPKSPSGEKFLEVLEIDPDHSHPRGIFHNQYFSGLAGGVSTALEISGFKIPLPSTSRMTLSKGTCGDLSTYSFSGSLLAPVTPDSTAPTLLSLTVPSGGVSTSELIVLTFSERVTVDGCKGSFVLSGPEIVKVNCFNATAFKDTITLSVSSVTTPGDYTLTIETEAVLDLAGNRITYVVATPTFTISSTETAAPTVVRTSPLPGASSPDGVISFLFTEDIVAADGLLSLSLCGSSCATKNLVKNYHVTGDNDTVSVSGNVLSIALGPAAKDFAFYELVLASGLVEDTAGNALAAPYSLEFFVDSGSGTPTGFDMETSTAKVKLGSSTESDLVFDFALAAGTAPGAYNLCYCNDQDDITLAVLGDSAKTYKLQDNTVCNAQGVIDMDSDADSCVSKCSAGCVGPTCYCDGLPEAKAGALCLPKEDCAAKCTAESSCIGINVHDTLPICYLVDTCNAFTPPTAPSVVTVPVVTASLALSMSAADVAVLMADQDTAMQAIATGLTTALGVDITVLNLNFNRRLSADARSLQTTVDVTFYTKDMNGYSVIQTLSVAGADVSSVITAIGSELTTAGMGITILAVTISAPTYSSIQEDPASSSSGYGTGTGYGYGYAQRQLDEAEDEASTLPAPEDPALGEERELSDGTHVSLVSASYLFFQSSTGTACTQVTDFKERAGTVTVTNRVLVGVDYVVTPDVAQSLEVTGPDLTYDATDLLSKDRIMVIDCGGTCGVSGPTDKVTGYGTVGAWNGLLPHSYFQDAPWADAQNTPVNVETPTTPMPTPVGNSYEVTYDSSYYAGFNIIIDTSSSLEVAIDGVLKPISSFQCYTMCSAGCTGPWCKCSGYLPGIDSSTSKAICATRETCQYLCDQLGDDCNAIDMSKSVDRCFLNNLPKVSPATTPPRVDAVKTLNALAVDAGYQIVHKVGPNSAFGSRLRSLEAMLPPTDLGYSWSQILRFPSLTFSTGGTFKLCFCDSTLLSGAATPCLTKKDYAVEVGKVHSSGVSCLLSQPKLQRAVCVEMKHGADPKPLRCYSGLTPPVLTPPLLSSTQVDIDESTASGSYVPPAGTSAGSYSPEEVGVQPAPQSGNAAPPR